MEIRNIMVTEKAVLDELYQDSALTWEGLALDSIPDAADWISKHTTFKKEPVTAYITPGGVMNEMYGLTGDNAYPKNLTIVSFKLSDMENLGSLMTARFAVGGRWFDDIVDNNQRREDEKFD